MSDDKRFNDWNDVVDCNECIRYYDSSCDGVPVGSKRTCMSFQATRNVIIPEQIKRLQRSIKFLEWYCLLIAVSVLIHIIWS